jgi:quinolinate synthase
MMSSIEAKIQELKKQRRAVILAHNYQLPEIQDIADYVGDSLGLSRQATQTDAKVIVFCGVDFMAETAAILNPNKTVLLPDTTAGCPMAMMIDAAQLRELKQQHPDSLVVCYVNSTAAVKAECDYCCTSGNAVKLVNSLPADREIIFVPDKFLGDYVATQTGRKMILWPGYCPTHVRILDTMVTQLKREHPGAIAMAHPECTRPVREAADVVCSTEGMCKYVAGSGAKEFIICTELGMIHRLKRENPDKVFYPVGEFAMCPNMKKNTLEKVLWSLERMEHKVVVPAEIADKARLAVERMLAVTA